MIALTFSKVIVEQLREELIEASALNNLRLYKIVQSLLWVHEKKSLKEIARLLGVDVKTISNWRNRFIVKRFGWLRGHHYKGRGRKAKLTDDQKRRLYELVKAGPEPSGFDCGIWNSAMIVELIWRRWGVKYNPRYLPRLLKQLGLSYQKARFVSDRLEEEAYERARQDWVNERWPALLQRAKETKAVILFTDEVSFALWGSLGRTWSPRGQQPVVKTTGQRKGMKIFGAIDFHSGAFYYREAHSYKLSAKALKALKDQGLEAEQVAQLKALRGIDYATATAFRAAVAETLGVTLSESMQNTLLKAAEGNGKFNSESYIEFLHQLLEQISRPIILIEDSVSYHGSQAVKQFCAQQPRLHKEPLPKFSPDFNPIEKLWKNTKSAATHLKYFKSFDDLRASVLNTFEKYLQDATKIIRVMKKLRARAGLEDLPSAA